MNPDRDDNSQLLERIRRHYTPRDLTDAESAAFRRRLNQRLSRPRPQRAWVPSLAGAALVLALGLWVLGPNLIKHDPRPPGTAELAARVEWERDVLFPPELIGNAEPDNFYSEDLMAIATQLLSESSL